MTPIEKPFSEYASEELFLHNRSRLLSSNFQDTKWFVYYVPFTIRPRRDMPLNGMWDKAFLCPVSLYSSVITYLCTKHPDDTIPTQTQSLYGGYYEHQYTFSDVVPNIAFLLTEEEAIQHAGYCPEKRSQFFGSHGQGLTYDEALRYTRDYHNFYESVSTIAKVLFDESGVSIPSQTRAILEYVNHPRVKLDEQDTIQYYASIRDMLNSRTSTIRVGRFVRKLRPDLSDSKIEEMVRNWNAYFVDPEYTLVVGDQAEDFVKGYTLPRNRDRNPSLPCNFKNLAYSCMHYSKDNWSNEHPVSAYASGEFEIAMAISQDNKIGGRVVIHKPSKSAGPTYVMDNFAIDLLRDYMKENDINMDPCSSAWDGAKIEVTPSCRNKEFMVLPYFDYGGTVYRNGDEAYLNSSRGATLVYGTSSTCGVCYPQEPCVVCGEYDDDDGLEYHVTNGAGMTCYSCGQHVFTADTGEVVPEDETVYYRGSYYSQDSEGLLYCEHSGTFFLAEDVGYIELLCGGYLRTGYLEQYTNNNGWDNISESDWPDWKLEEENEDDDEEQEDVA